MSRVLPTARAATRRASLRSRAASAAYSSGERTTRILNGILRPPPCRQPVTATSVGCRAGGVVVARTRRKYTAKERRELWERWKRGESISEIGRALDRAPGTISCTIRLRGGVAPSERRRSLWGAKTPVRL